MRAKRGRFYVKPNQEFRGMGLFARDIETLDEEKETDEILTDEAKGPVNAEAV